MPTSNASSHDSLFPAAVGGLLSRQLPGADPSRAERVGEGWNAVAWRVQDPDGDWIIRVPKLDYARDEIERQTCLGPRLLELGFPVPSGWQVIRDAAGKVVAGAYRFVPGELAPSSGVRALRRLPPQLAVLLNRLHALPVSLGNACGGGDWQIWPGFYSRLVDQCLPWLTPASASYVRRLAGHLPVSVITMPRFVVVHGDLAPWHLVCDSDIQIRAVLDFLGPVNTDPAIDFGRIVQHWGLDFAESVLSGYEHEVDPGFRRRMVIYAHLEPLKSIKAGTERNQHQWVAWGRRKLAALAAADRKRSRPRLLETDY
jgi:aminoglycoside phosphotransferase (APT) family kinase protein